MNVGLIESGICYFFLMRTDRILRIPLRSTAQVGRASPQRRDRVAQDADSMVTRRPISPQAQQ